MSQDLQPRGPGPATDLDTLRLITHAVYGLHAFALVTALLGTATILGSFLGTLPSIGAVILNYYKRASARGTWLESHFRWQIRTFWFAALWFIVGWVLIFTVIGFFAGLAVLVVAGLW